MSRQRLDELGIPPALFEAMQPGQLVFTDLIERLRRAEIDVLYCGGYPREVGFLRRQMAEVAFVPPMITSGAHSSEAYDLVVGPAAEGTLVVADHRFDTADSAEFEAKLRGAYDMEPDLRVTRGYASAKSGRRLSQRRHDPGRRRRSSAALRDVPRLRRRSPFRR